MHTPRILASVSSALALVTCLCTAAPAVEFSISTRSQSVVPADRIDIPVAAMNPSDAAVEVLWPARIAGTIAVGERTWQIELAADQSTDLTTSLPPHQFAVRGYAGTIPSEASAGAGFLEVRLADEALVRAGLLIAARDEAQAPQPDAAPQQPTSSLVRPEPALNALGRAFADRVSPHEPIYFVYGPDEPAGKFQFSLKYRLLDLGTVSPRWATRTIQFAYTQCSLWDIGSESSPFHDTSYMPEVMFEALTPETDSRSNVNWLGFQAGYKHESNGRDGPLSRSLDIAQLRAAVALGKLDGWHVIIAPKVWAYLNTSDYNEDIEDYRGYGTLQLIAGKNDGPTLSLSTWAGKDFDHASLQLDLNVPIRMTMFDVKSYLLIQYFNGYGENLRDYDQKSDTIRAGFAIVR